MRYAATGSGRAERFFTVNPETGDVSIRDYLSAGTETKYEVRGREREKGREGEREIEIER